MHVTICRRVARDQRDIIKRRCTINAYKYKLILNKLIDDYQSYSNMEQPEGHPQPIVIGLFNSNDNNTDKSDGINTSVEDKFDEQTMKFLHTGEPTENTRAYQNKSEFIFS